VKLFVFELTTAGHGVQSAVVAADSRDEAWARLRLDQTTRNGAVPNLPVDATEDDPAWHVQLERDFHRDKAGYIDAWHAPNPETKIVAVVDGPVVYTYGSDG